VLHLNHLTPINEAAIRSFPDVPRIGHLHGTELLMLREITEGPPPGWDHAEQWAERMRRWAQSCERLFVLSPDAAERVPDLLGAEPERVIAAPNGFDPELFDRRPLTGAQRHELWRRWLVEQPRGWDEGGEPGSIAYTDEDIGAFDEGPVLLYVGRYTEVKRIPLLIRAYARARERFPVRAPLVLFGGYPGEWEGEHPMRVVRETGARDVFLAGWRGHSDLASGLNAADVVVLPSVHEQFGQVLIEGMACGLPVIAVNNHGPASIVDDGETGLLVPPDDPAALAAALRRWLGDTSTRRRFREVAHERLGDDHGVRLGAGGQHQGVGGGVRGVEVGARAWPGEEYPITDPAIPGLAPEAVDEARVAGEGAHAHAAPRQVHDLGQSLEQHVVSLAGDHGRDTEQLPAGRRPRGELGRLDAGLRDVYLSGPQRVPVEQPGSGPRAGRDDGGGGRQDGAFPSTGNLRTHTVATQRHVHEDDQTQPSRLGHQHLRGRRGNQSVDQDDGAIGQLRHRPGEPGPRGRVRSGPRARHRVLAHGPAEGGEPPADPAVVGIAAARLSRVIDAVRHDDVHCGHSARS